MTTLACPTCGEQHDPSVILIAADAYTIKVLEQAGNRIVRKNRSRMAQHAAMGKPLCKAYTVWPLDSDAEVMPLLRGTWTALAELSIPWTCYNTTPSEVAAVLNGYVCDLLLTGEPHTLEDLAYRLNIVHD